MTPEKLKAAWKVKMKVASTERNRVRLKKRIDEEKKKQGKIVDTEVDERRKRLDRRSVAPVERTVQASRSSVPPKSNKASPDSPARGGRKRRFSSVERVAPKKEKSASPRKVKSREDALSPDNRRKGRPLGWRKGDTSYLVFKGLSPSPVKTASAVSMKAQRELVNKIKKKYSREVTPCPDEDSNGVWTRRKAARASPMKTRALLKKSEKEEKSLVPRCVLCRSKKDDLFKCAECMAYYHLRKCCRYSDEAAAHVESGGRRRWLCARCASCALCNEYISDAHNVECGLCTLPFHGKCTEQAGKMCDGQFFCGNCAMLDAVIKKDDGKKEPKKPEKPTVVTNKAKRRLVKGWQFVSVPSESDEAAKRMHERNELYDHMMDLITRSKSGNANSPSKFGVISSSPQKLKKVALQSDIDLFEAAKASLAAERKQKQKHVRWGGGLAAVCTTPSTSRSAYKERESSCRGQWVYVGSKKDKMRSLYASPYPPEIVESPSIYICPFCLRVNNDVDMFRIHQLECTWSCPPGNEIYRDTDKRTSFFEVDGAIQKLYCRRLCLLGKLFISSKTLVEEVETFLFYVLVEHTHDGAEIVGYFSKEKNPSKNNNLSCILTLPSVMNGGYGRLLIDLSYELSRIERKIGSPEHPLSDLGLIAYRGFWRSSILCYLRQLRGTHVASIKQISLATRISPQDVINQLMRDGLLFYRDGIYYVNTEQRAYRMPLAMSRRKTIDHAKLKWRPEDPNYEHLDSSKINYYV